MTGTFGLVHDGGSGDLIAARSKMPLVSQVMRLLGRLLVVLVFSTAMLATTKTSFAQSSPTVSDAQNSCDNANAGMYDLSVTNSSIVDSFSIVGAAGFIYTITLLGFVIDSNAGIGSTNNILSGETSGAFTYTFAALIATFLYLDILASGGTGRIQVRCTAPGSDPDPSPNPNTLARNQAAMSVFMLTNGLFSPFLTMNQTVNLLMGQSAEQARLLGLVRKYIFFADLYDDIEADYDAARRLNSLRPGSTSAAELAAMERELDLIDQKLSAMELAFDLAGITPAMIDAIDNDYSHRNLPLTATRTGFTPSADFYAPNPLSQASGPLAAFNSFGNGGSFNSTLVETRSFSLWTEVGIVHQLGHGANGNSGFAVGGKLGGAFRINDRIGLGADVFGTSGSFGVNNLNLTGDFTSYGLSVTPVLRITDELFLSVSGTYEHFTIGQNAGGVTSNYFAEKYGISARLAGAYWYEFFLLEPDASVSYDMFHIHQTRASNNTVLPATAAHAIKLSLGGRISASTIPIWGLPSVTPYLSAHGNWFASSIGGANYNGPTLDLGAGVTVPLGDTGSLGLGVGINNLFLQAGSNISANASLNGQF